MSPPSPSSSPTRGSSFQQLVGTLDLPRAGALVPLAALALASCQPRVPVCQPLAPLVDEGEVYVFAEAFPPAVRRLSITLESVTALSASGQPVALELQRAALRGPELGQPRLVAWGRVPPGAYVGLALTARRAVLAAADGASDLLVARGPTVVATAFVVRRRHAAVVALSADYARLVSGVGFAPAFSAVTPPKTSPALHGYAANTGSHTVTVYDTSSRRVVGVVPTGRGPRGLAVDALGGRVYVALAEEDEVEVLDATSTEPLPRLRLRRGDEPHDLALAPDGRTLVTANRGSNTASFVDPRAGVEVARVPTGEEPAAVLVDRTGQRAFVLNARGGNITVLDVPSRAVVATVAAEAEPLRAHFDRRGTRLFVIHGGSPYLLVLAVPDLAVVDRVHVGLGMTALRVDPSTDLVYVGLGDGGGVRVYDALSLAPVDRVELPDAVSWMAISELDGTMSVLLPSRRAVAVVDLTTRKVVGEVEVGCAPHAVRLGRERP